MVQLPLFVQDHPVDKLVDSALFGLDFVLDILQHPFVLFIGRIFRSNLMRREDHDDLGCFLDVDLMPESIAEERYGPQDWNAVIALGDRIFPQT